MKFKSMLLLVVAVGCGLVAMLGVQQALKGEKKGPEEMGRVVVATTDILPGVPLDSSNVAYKEWPKNVVPPGAVIDMADLEERSLKVGAVANEILMQAKLNEKGVFGASSEIPEGMRVVTTQVNSTKTHSGLIRPGDRVDILCTYKVRKGTQGLVGKTKTVLQFVKVFATDSIRHAGNAAEGQEFNAKNISLLLTPEQANLLKLAESKGELHLALRNKDDKEAVTVSDISDEIFEDTVAEFGREDEKLSENDPRRLMADWEAEDGDVRSFLARQQQITEQSETQSAPAAAPSQDQLAAVEPPPKKVWKITIFAGNEIKEQEIELPENEEDDHPQALFDVNLTGRRSDLDSREAELAAREQALREREKALNPPDGGAEGDGNSEGGLPKTLKLTPEQEKNAGPLLKELKKSLREAETEEGEGEEDSGSDLPNLPNDGKLKNMLQKFFHGA